MSPVTTETSPPGWGLGPSPATPSSTPGNYTTTADASPAGPLASPHRLAGVALLRLPLAGLLLACRLVRILCNQQAYSALGGGADAARRNRRTASAAIALIALARERRSRRGRGDGHEPVAVRAAHPRPSSGGGAVGVAHVIGYLGAAEGPLLVGVLHDATGGWTAPLSLLVASSLLAGLFAALAGRLPFIA